MSGAVTLTMLLIEETDRAVLVARDESEAGVWLPKSVTGLRRWGRRGRIGGREIVSVTMPPKLAEQKGLTATAPSAAQGKLL